MKRHIVIFIVVVVALLGLFILYKNVFLKDDYKNISYNIENINIKLKDGLAKTEVATDSSAKMTTMYFGNEAKGDLNGDGKEDIVFLLTQNNGGSGTFYYVVAAIKTSKGYVGTNAIFLGDRIAPQSTEILNGLIAVNYAQREINEPMTTPPSIGVSKYLKIVENSLIEVSNPN